MAITWRSHGSRLAVARHMCGRRATLVWQSCGNRMSVARQSHASLMAATWQSHGNRAAAPWQYHCNITATSLQHHYHIPAASLQQPFLTFESFSAKNGRTIWGVFYLKSFFELACFNRLSKFLFQDTWLNSTQVESFQDWNEWWRISNFYENNWWNARTKT